MTMTNVSLAEEETQSYDDCADVRNTTLLQREDLLVQFLLLTRGNPDCAQMFNDESLTDLEQTYFNVNRPTKVVIHGFRWAADDLQLAQKLKWQPSELNADDIICRSVESNNTSHHMKTAVNENTDKTGNWILRVKK